VRHAVVSGELALERLDAGPEHQFPGAEDGVDGVEDVGALFLVLGQVAPHVKGHLSTSPPGRGFRRSA
jgi:hypothetical protein